MALSLARLPTRRFLIRLISRATSFFLVVCLAGAQHPPGVYWNGVIETVPSLPALDRVVKAHGLWLQTYGQGGARADLSHNNLSNFSLKGVNLSGADLEGAYLAHTDF